MTGLLYWSINSFLYCKNCNLQKIVALKMIFFLNNFNSFKYCNGLSILRINESWGSIYLTATHFFPSWIILWVCKISEFTLLKQILQFITWCHFYVSSEIFFYTPDQSCFKDDLSFLYPIYYQIYIKIFTPISSSNEIIFTPVSSSNEIVISFSSIIHEVLSKTASYNHVLTEPRDSKVLICNNAPYIICTFIFLFTCLYQWF